MGKRMNGGGNFKEREIDSYVGGKGGTEIRAPFTAFSVSSHFLSPGASLYSIFFKNIYEKLGNKSDLNRQGVEATREERK